MAFCAQDDDQSAPPRHGAHHLSKCSGLPNSKQITTAKDLAILSRRVMQDLPAILRLLRYKEFFWNGRTYRTHNSLVKNYSGADGLKTGYTRRSGFNLATTAVRNNDRLIGIVLGGRSGATRDKHMRKILDQEFRALEKEPIARRSASPQETGTAPQANVGCCAR